MLHVTLAHKTLLPISLNGINQITLNKPLGNHLNKDIINASRDYHNDQYNILVVSSSNF
jgi:hypothetical protein